VSPAGEHSQEAVRALGANCSNAGSLLVVHGSARGLGAALAGPLRQPAGNGSSLGALRGRWYSRTDLVWALVCCRAGFKMNVDSVSSEEYFAAAYSARWPVISTVVHCRWLVGNQAHVRAAFRVCSSQVNLNFGIWVRTHRGSGANTFCLQRPCRMFFSLFCRVHQSPAAGPAAVVTVADVGSPEWL
jgi:hypothetical protein